MEGYNENKEFPNLQYIADRIAEDDDFDYLALEYKTADKNKITLSADSDSIYTSLKDSPYIFEIDRSIKIASIDGVKVSENLDNNFNSELIQNITFNVQEKQLIVLQ